MAFSQLGYQYMRPLFAPSERPGAGGGGGGSGGGSGGPRGLLGAAELSPPGRLSGLLSSMYAGGAPYYGAFLPYAAEVPLFHQLGAGYELKESPGVPPSSLLSGPASGAVSVGAGGPPAAFFPYGQFQFGDPSRPKNATRESTATLKAWLGEHRKNPYPTKGEKIMLAIITKMTLTQVSTWFANARRRLKKENKMTWAPRSRADEEEEEEEEEEEGEEEEEEIDLEHIDGESAKAGPLLLEEEEEEEEEEEGVRPLLHPEAKSPGSEVSSSLSSSSSSSSDGEDLQGGGGGGGCKGAFLLPASSASASPSGASSPPRAPPPKPKIWSLAETATSPDHPAKGPPNCGLQGGAAPGHRLGTPAASASASAAPSCPLSKLAWSSRPYSAQPHPHHHHHSHSHHPHPLALLNAPQMLGLAALGRATEQGGQDSLAGGGAGAGGADPASVLEVEKKLIKTAFQPVQRRPQNQLDAAMVLSALSSS